MNSSKSCRRNFNGNFWRNPRKYSWKCLWRNIRTNARTKFWKDSRMMSRKFLRKLLVWSQKKVIKESGKGLLQELGRHVRKNPTKKKFNSWFEEITEQTQNGYLEKNQKSFLEILPRNSWTNSITQWERLEETTG